MSETCCGYTNWQTFTINCDFDNTRVLYDAKIEWFHTLGDGAIITGEMVKAFYDRMVKRHAVPAGTITTFIMPQYAGVNWEELGEVWTTEWAEYVAHANAN